MVSPTKTDKNQSWNSKEHGVYAFLQARGAFGNPLEAYEREGLLSNVVRDLLKVDRIDHGRIICHFIVKPIVSNAHHTLHGGAVATIAELVSTACARTVVNEAKVLILGELSMSYLSGASKNAELEVDGCIVRSGKNVTATSVEFRIKGTKKVMYTARATFFTAPVPNL